MNIQEAQEKYLALCEEAGKQKVMYKYANAVGMAQGYLRAVGDFFGPEEVLDIINHAESINATVLGIPHFNQQNLTHA